MWDKTGINPKNSWPHQVLKQPPATYQNNHGVSQQVHQCLREQPLSHPFKLVLQCLTPKERAALVLHYQQQHPQAHVATMLGITPEGLIRLFDSALNKLSTQTPRYFLQ